MKKYILYAHDGSGNHGCEALVRSTAQLLDVGRERTILVSERPEEDVRYGLEPLCTIVKRGTRGHIPRTSLSFIKAYSQLKLKKDYVPLDMLGEVCGANARAGDVALSIGGDTYCYDFSDRLAETHAMWKCGGLRTVYWGCSIEPKLLEDPAIAADIRKYDLITARETISYEALKKINPNTVLVADSAFLLEKTELPLPNGFSACDLVGINSSPLIEQSESIPGIARKNYQCLIEKILSDTDMGILLIPHVVWDSVDDRSVLQCLGDEYAHTGRVHLVQDCTCEELKGYISRCRFFVGARTHATIAAYSSYVPTLAVGYSVKAKGIAKDLFGTEEHYVVPVQKLMAANDLRTEFEWLISNEDDVRKKLKETIPEYRNRVFRGVSALKKL